AARSESRSRLGRRRSPTARFPCLKSQWLVVEWHRETLPVVLPRPSGGEPENSGRSASAPPRNAPSSERQDLAYRRSVAVGRAGSPARTARQKPSHHHRSPAESPAPSRGGRPA